MYLNLLREKNNKCIYFLIFYSRNKPEFLIVALRPIHWMHRNEQSILLNILTCSKSVYSSQLNGINANVNGVLEGWLRNV